MNKELLQEVRDNQNRINNCKRHKFTLSNPPYTFGLKVECENCGGKVDAIYILHYCQGYKAAGGNPNDIVEGYE